MSMNEIKGGLFRGREVVGVFLNGRWLWLLASACFSRGWDNDKAWDNDAGWSND